MGGDAQPWPWGTHPGRGHTALSTGGPSPGRDTQPHTWGGGVPGRGDTSMGQAQHSVQAGVPGSRRDVQPWIHLGKGRAAWARGIPLPEGIPSSGRHESPSKLTVTGHADQQALLEAALLAAVAVDADDRAVLVLEALLVLDVLLDAAAEEALRGEAGGITWGPRSVTGAPSPIPGPIPVPCSPRRRGRRSGSRRRRPRRPCRAAPSR